jgi:hypothetical protein
LVLTAAAMKRLTIPCAVVNARERAAAWIVTGPLGHFWSASADIALLWTRFGWSRAVSRGRGARGRRRHTS